MFSFNPLVYSRKPVSVLVMRSNTKTNNFWALVTKLATELIDGDLPTLQILPRSVCLTNHSLANCAMRKTGLCLVVCTQTSVTLITLIITILTTIMMLFCCLRITSHHSFTLPWKYYTDGEQIIITRKSGY